jgi:hypothetical protein
MADPLTHYLIYGYFLFGILSLVVLFGEGNGVEMGGGGGK